MEYHGRQQGSRMFHRPCKHGSQKCCIDTLHQIPVINSKYQAGKNHGRRSPEDISCFSVNDAPENQLLGKRRCQAVKHYPQPKRHIGLGPGYLPERFGKPLQLQKCHKDIQPQRQRRRHDKKRQYFFPFRPFCGPKMKKRLP